MLFQIEDSRLQQQMDLVCQEQSELRALQEMLSGREMLARKPARILERLEKQIRSRLQFLENTQAACRQLQSDVDRIIDPLLPPE